MNKFFILCLIASLIGILSLLLISTQIKPINVESYSDLKENEYVSVKGKIISEKYFQDSDFSIIILENNITLICSCRFPKNITIYAEGSVEEYQNKLQVNADKIEITG